MEGLFFAVEPIWWIVPIDLTSIFITLLWGIFLIFILWYKNSKKNEVLLIWNKLKKYHFQPQNTDNRNYAEQTLIEIRKYLTYKFEPENSWAHLPIDIKKYSHDTQLDNIIEQLEHAEYTNTVLPKETQENINRELIKKLKIW